MAVFRRKQSHPPAFDSVMEYRRCLEHSRWAVALDEGKALISDLCRFRGLWPAQLVVCHIFMLVYLIKDLITVKPPISRVLTLRTLGHFNYTKARLRGETFLEGYNHD